MGTVETSETTSLVSDFESHLHIVAKKPSIVKMSEAEAQDAFIIFDEAYEGNDVDAFYLGDIPRFGLQRDQRCRRSGRWRHRVGLEENRLRRLQAHPRRRQGRHLLHRSQGGLRR